MISFWAVRFNSNIRTIFIQWGERTKSFHIQSRIKNHKNSNLNPFQQMILTNIQVLNLVKLSTCLHHVLYLVWPGQLLTVMMMRMMRQGETSDTNQFDNLIISKVSRVLVSPTVILARLLCSNSIGLRCSIN